MRTHFWDLSSVALKRQGPASCRGGGGRPSLPAQPLHRDRHHWLSSSLPALLSHHQVGSSVFCNESSWKSLSIHPLPLSLSLWTKRNSIEPCTRSFVRESLAAGLPIIPFNYPTFVIVERQRQSKREQVSKKNHDHQESQESQHSSKPLVVKQTVMQQILVRSTYTCNTLLREGFKNSSSKD